MNIEFQSWQGTRAVVRRSLCVVVPLVLLVSCRISGGVTDRSGPAALETARRPSSAYGTSACTDRIADLPEPEALGPGDPIALATDNLIADLPVPGLGERSVESVLQYSTIDDYVGTALIANPELRRAAMERDGFDGGISVAYTTGPDSYGIMILRFADQASALDYRDVHLSDVCEDTPMVRSVPGLAGVSYMRPDGLAKAAFVVGNLEVQVNICTCVEEADRVNLAGRWGTAVAQQLAGH